MGFHRQRQPASFNRAEIAAAITRFIASEETARIEREADPFGVADRCPVNPTGHQTIVSCGEVVCWHCSRIFWR